MFLRHTFDLHADGFQAGSEIVLPGSPNGSNAVMGVVISPQIHTIGICIVTAYCVPKCPEIHFGTVFFIGVLVLVKGGELLSIMAR